LSTKHAALRRKSKN